MTSNVRRTMTLLAVLLVLHAALFTSAPLMAELSRLAYAHFNDPQAYPAETLAVEPAGELTTPTPAAS